MIDLAYRRIRNMRLLIIIAASSALWGCAAVMLSNANFVEVELSIESREDALAAFGPPLRQEAEPSGDVLYYRLTRSGLTGRAITETQSGVVLLFPLLSTTSYKENLKLHFRGDLLTSAEELLSKDSGFGCGLMGHGQRSVCQSLDGSSTRTVDDLRRFTRQIARVTTPELPAACTKTPVSGSDIACAARDFLRSRKHSTNTQAYEVFETDPLYSIVVTDNAAPLEEPRLVFFSKSTNLMAMRKQRSSIQH